VEKEQSHDKIKWSVSFLLYTLHNNCVWIQKSIAYFRELYKLINVNQNLYFFKVLFTSNYQYFENSYFTNVEFYDVSP